MELNTAYERNDLQRVMEILHDLQQGKTFNSKSDTANEKLTLQVALNQLPLPFFQMPDTNYNRQSQ